MSLKSQSPRAEAEAVGVLELVTVVEASSVPVLVHSRTRAGASSPGVPASNSPRPSITTVELTLNAQPAVAVVRLNVVVKPPVWSRSSPASARVPPQTSAAKTAAQGINLRIVAGLKG